MHQLQVKTVESRIDINTAAIALQIQLLTRTCCQRTTCGLLSIVDNWGNIEDEQEVVNTTIVDDDPEPEVDVLAATATIHDKDKLTKAQAEDIYGVTAKVKVYTTWSRRGCFQPS